MLWKITELIAVSLKEFMLIISKVILANFPLAAAIACFSVCIREALMRKGGISSFLSVAHLKAGTWVYVSPLLAIQAEPSAFFPKCK